MYFGNHYWSLSSTRKVFNYLSHLNAEKWYRYLLIFLYNNSARKKFRLNSPATKPQKCRLVITCEVGGHCNQENPSKICLKHKSHKIFFIHIYLYNSAIILCHTAMLCAKFINISTTASQSTDRQNFMRFAFEMDFGQMSNIAKGSSSSLQITVYIHTTRAHFSDRFSLKIQIWWKYHFAPKEIKIQWMFCTCANCLVIWWIGVESDHYNILHITITPLSVILWYLHY